MQMRMSGKGEIRVVAVDRRRETNKGWKVDRNGHVGAFSKLIHIAIVVTHGYACAQVTVLI
jgi:hypothetical protein